MQPRPKASIELRFAPNLALVSDVRRFIAIFYEQVLGDPHTAARLALAGHELLENVVKYATDGETRACLDVESTPRPRVVIRTYNRASDKDMATLENLFREMREVRDASAFYVLAKERAMKNPASASRLGLARICAEAAMALDFARVPEGVELRAQLDLEGAS